jgi:hypothetical protein
MRSKNSLPSIRLWRMYHLCRIFRCRHRNFHGHSLSAFLSLRSPYNTPRRLVALLMPRKAVICTPVGRQASVQRSLSKTLSTNWARRYPLMRAREFRIPLSHSAGTIKSLFRTADRIENATVIVHQITDAPHSTHTRIPGDTFNRLP